MSRRSRPSCRLLLLAALAWPGIAAACALPAPGGPHPVGFQRFELTDEERRGLGGEAADAPRTLPAAIWYPAERAGEGRAYLSPAEAGVQLPALARNLRYPPAPVAGIGACRAPDTEGAAPARASARFPLVVLSHGFYSYPLQNTALAEALASHGYVVVALGHPGDSADVRLADGRLVPTNMAEEKPAFLAWRHAFHSASEHATRAPLVEGYAEALAGSRLGASVEAWRDDVLFAVRALQAGDVPAPVRPALESADAGRLAVAGMSFGGSTAASACRRLPACRAAISLDGLNFDPALFDADLQRPLLVVLGDWVRFPMYDGLPSEAGFNPNDYAYERWETVGLSPDVLRVMVPGTRHMSFTDLPLLMEGEGLEAHFGDADPVAAAGAIAAVSRAFLDVHLQDADPAGLPRAIDASGLVRHDPRQTRDWARSRSTGNP